MVDPLSQGLVGLLSGLGGLGQGYFQQKQQNFQNQNTANELAVKQKLADLQGQKFGLEQQTQQGHNIENGLQLNPDSGQMEVNPDYLIKNPDGTTKNYAGSHADYEAQAKGVQNKVVDQADYFPADPKTGDPGLPHKMVPWEMIKDIPNIQSYRMIQQIAAGGGGQQQPAQPAASPFQSLVSPQSGAQGPLLNRGPYTAADTAPSSAINPAAQSASASKLGMSPAMLAEINGMPQAPVAQQSLNVAPGGQSPYQSLAQAGQPIQSGQHMANLRNQIGQTKIDQLNATDAGQKWTSSLQKQDTEESALANQQFEQDFKNKTLANTEKNQTTANKKQVLEAGSNALAKETAPLEKDRDAAQKVLDTINSGVPISWTTLDNSFSPSSRLVKMIQEQEPTSIAGERKGYSSPIAHPLDYIGGLTGTYHAPIPPMSPQAKSFYADQLQQKIDSANSEIASRQSSQRTNTAGIAKGAGINLSPEDISGATATSKSPPPPAQDKTIANYAKQHGLDYGKAAAILKKRGYAGS